MNDAPRTALILGATGGIGFEMAQALSARGWRLRCLHRRPELHAAEHPNWEWVPGDATEVEDVCAAAEGAQLIVHAVNPPGYRSWSTLVPAMAEATAEAARRHGADIFLPGTVYNFGPDAGLEPREDAPQNPLTRKGRIRVELEARFREVASPSTRVIILRAGDFFGAPGNGWLAEVMVKPGKPVGSVWAPGAAGVAHQWAYLPDMAETAVRLAERRDALEPFSRFHFRGHVDTSGREFAEAIRRVTGQPRLPVRRFPWALTYLMAPFSETMREVLEMRYLWKTPLVMPNDALVRVLGAEPHTPLDVAMRATLERLGCLPRTAPLAEAST